ncbi:MAG: InlB B-repeat-containing protein [Fibrobacter sp.]|nr:InlB B-repeat-containing protein [Fibrobacter sp.]
MSDYFEYTVNSQEELPDLSELEKIFGNDWKFAGWSASQNAFDATFMNVPNNTGYTAFYPHFRKEKNITILFNGIQKTLETIIIDRNETDKSINDRVNKIIQKFIKPANKDMGNEIYAFENWEENDDGYYVPKYKIFPKQYTIEFVVNGKNVQTLKGNYGTTAHLPKPEPIEGYTFTGWKVTDAAGRILPVTKATVIFGITYSNLKVEALFEPTAYEINLHNKFATKIQSVSYTIESDDIILPHLKNTKSHIFEGWFDNENFAGEAVTKIPHGSIGDVKLFAKWTPKPIEVKIRGRIEDTFIYDGKEHIAQTFEITTNDTSYTAKDFKFNGKNYISAIEAGEYSMGLKASDFENTNPDFKNVKFEVTDGKLTIAKRKITISSASAQKAYDGKPLTSHKINIDGEFTKDEGIEIEWDESAAQTEVGTAKNSFHIAAKKGTNLDNYDIELIYGKLTVTEQEKKEEEKIVSTDFEKKEEKADTTDSEKKGIVGTEKKDKDKENKPETKKTIKGFGATNGDNDDGKTAIETLAAPKFSISTNGRSIEVNNAVIGSKLAIYDMQGRLVRMAKISHGTEHVDLENSGSYIIKTFNRVVRVNLD